MRITLHDYVTDPLLPQVDGVNLAHENISTLLRSYEGGELDIEFHDFNRILEDERYAYEILAATDCVISNVGPHAHYYFYLREKFSLDFRIIRDVRTAIWSSYLLQENLCAPYLRPKDLLMVSSNYTRGIYEKLFPHLRQNAIFRCYPLTVSFPGQLPPRPEKDDDKITLGYIGRLSEDKNFPDVVQLLIALNKARPGAYRLIARGDIHSASCQPDNIEKLIADNLGEGDYFRYLPPLVNGQIWETLSEFDIMVFPSTSNLETLGRVLIEASYAGVPVVCGEHAAAPELVPEHSLCSVEYSFLEEFDTHFDHSLGQVCAASMAEAVMTDRLEPSVCHLEYQSHPDKFINTLLLDCHETIRQGEAYSLTGSQRKFIESLDIELPESPDIEEANRMIKRLIPWFLKLQMKTDPERESLLEKLLEISRFPERTRKFIEKSVVTRGDFTNVGGIDIELCHVAGFYPRFVIQKPSG